MVKGIEFWLLADGRGKIWKMMNDTLDITEVTHFHSGKVRDLAMSSQQLLAVTAGEDGQVKLWDFIRDKEHYSRQFVGKATSLDILNYSEAN